MNNEPQVADLRVFCAVAQSGSFAAAAARLGTSPAHVSKRIGILEGQLGVRLFHRTTRRVQLSAEGETALDQARRVLDEMDALGELVGAGRRELTGPLRIATSVRLGREHVAPLLSAFGARHPALDLWLELVDRPVDLQAEGFDIDLRMGEPAEPRVIAHLIARNSRVLCAAPDYLARRGTPRTLADLAGHDCLLFRDRDRAWGNWRLLGPDGMASVRVTGRFGSNHADVIRQWCLDGHGVLLLAEWDMAPLLAEGRLVRVLPEWREPADLWALTTSRREQSAKVGACLDWLKTELRVSPGG
ncbi:LysR family transcriptional regulator [Derxia gummosa]|uniref:LysR family transcriptional regulator n=1 Tax=Derxia gummosa DSM 723 TaxID=1121388 RepID=A0A8B6X3S6_9BURK|nr:LysR family transcriptional regulator [Derxia gummosa]